MPTNVNAPCCHIGRQYADIVHAITTLLLENCGYQTDRKSYDQRKISLGHLVGATRDADSDRFINLAFARAISASPRLE